MSDTLLKEVWREVENLLNAGINIVPVRDKDDYYNGKLYAAKTPYSEWKKYQTEFIDRAILWDEMNNRNTTAVAMVCGAISGNLEIIDIEVKYYPGIDAIILHAINDLYPDILAKIRVNKTKNNGIHLVYRISDHEVPPSTKLADRLATEEELIMAPKRKTRCFIESRGTGGLATAPPSLGYAIRKNVPIQLLTWEERCSIVELCKSFNEVIKEDKPYTPPKSEIAYYDENPFEHYNRTVDPKSLLESFGWEFVRKSGSYLWFTKPGGRKGDVHAGFNTNKNTYRIWSTDAGFDSERSYTPSTILAHYQFSEDKSKTYHYLVQQGYGRIKPNMERTIIRKRAMQGEPMPTNASTEAIDQYNILIEQIKSDHPFGVFWEPDDESPDTMRISRLGFKQVATALGFRWYKSEIVQILKGFIHRRDERFFFDSMREYIKEQDPDTFEAIYNATQSFLQKNGRFESTQLDFLDESLILSDTRTACYKFFNNGYVEINAAGYSINEYENIKDNLVWFEKIQQRPFALLPADGNGDCLYCDFLRLACDLDNYRDHIMKCIGYLTHDFNDESLGYIVVLTEKCENPEDGGGTGKNLFGLMLKLSTTYTAVPGSQIQLNEKFLQSWKGERVFCVSDAEEDFRFGFLKDLTTGQVLIKKLYVNDETFNINLLPKFIVNTNYSYEIKDGGLKRRIIHIEFTDFFTLSGGVKKYYGKMFPQDWSERDYIGYDNFICQSIQLWLSDLTLTRPLLSETGWEKQFSINYNNTIVSFIKKHWDEWKQKEFISNTEFNKQLDDHLIELNIPLGSKFRPSSFRINKAITDWCNHNEYFFDSVTHKDNLNNVIRGRRFLSKEPPF